MTRVFLMPFFGRSESNGVKWKEQCKREQGGGERSNVSILMAYIKDCRFFPSRGFSFEEFLDELAFPFFYSQAFLLLFVFSLLLLLSALVS